MRFFKITKPILSFVISLCLSVIAFAQDKTITGTVAEQANHKALEGVTVTVKGTNRSTSTNSNGIFTITAPPSATLTFSYVGYTVEEVKVGTNTTMNINLSANTNTMDEVVVVGYGTKKRVNVLGAVSTIKTEDIEDLPVANLGSALINRLPGVGVNFASGKPGSTTTISIRNPTTFAGASLSGTTADPLYVIDGLIVTKQDFDNLDASLVESLSFLKDASAAIYGAAGAKGVVLITTKRGKAGKARISYSGYFGTSTTATKPKVLSAYEHAKMLNDGYELNNAPLTSRFSKADLDSLKGIGSDSWWYNDLWKPANLTRHTINVSGGTERISFFAGGNYYDEGGNFGGISIKKYGIRTGMNAKITNELSVDISVNSDFNKDERHTLKGSSDETDDFSIRALFLTPQWVPLTINGLPNNWNGINPPGAWNPIALENSGNYKRGQSQGVSLNASINYKPTYINGLTARFQFGKLNRNSSAKEYFPPFRVNNFVRRGQNSLLYSNIPAATATSLVSNSDQLGESSQMASSYQMIGSLAYGKKFKNQEFDVFVAMDQSEGEREEYYFYRNGQLVNGIDEFWAFNTSSSVIRNPSYTQSAKRSYLGRLNYSLNSKYLLEVIARYDASSNFAPENRWGLFPSVGLGWKVSDEKFFQNNIRFINNLKFRANFGLVGEDRVNAKLYESRFTQTTGMLFGSTVTNGLDPNVSPNRDITWEKSRHLNIGIDGTTLNNKLTFSVDVFRRYTYDGYDKLENGALPFTAGFGTAVVNYGRQLNWGSEYSFGYRDRINKDWNFNADVNFSITNSLLLQSYYNAALLSTPREIENQIGRNPRKYNGNNYGYIAKGILRTQAEVDALLAKNPNYRIGGAKPQVGFMDFEDVNKDGQINDNDITTMFDNTSSIIGFGITFGVSYKTFKLNANMNLTIGGKRFYDSEARKVPTTTQNAPAFWADHWTPENPNAKFPRADAPLARETSTFWAVNGTQSRINNMVLSYALPKKIAERLRIPEFRAFITGTNLWTLYSELDYKDPYTSNFVNYPTLRTFSLGLNVSM